MPKATPKISKLKVNTNKELKIILSAEKIYTGIVNKQAFEIHFPKGLTLILKFLRILPYKIYLFLVDKFVKR